MTVPYCLTGTNTCSKIHTGECVTCFFLALNEVKVVFDSDGVQFLLTVNCGVNLYRLILSLISGTFLCLQIDPVKYNDNIVMFQHFVKKKKN